MAVYLLGHGLSLPDLSLACLSLVAQTHLSVSLPPLLVLSLLPPPILVFFYFFCLTYFLYLSLTVLDSSLFSNRYTSYPLPCTPSLSLYIFFISPKPSSPPHLLYFFSIPSLTLIFIKSDTGCPRGARKVTPQSPPPGKCATLRCFFFFCLGTFFSSLAALCNHLAEILWISTSPYSQLPESIPASKETE